MILTLILKFDNSSRLHSWHNANEVMKFHYVINIVSFIVQLWSREELSNTRIKAQGLSQGRSSGFDDISFTRDDIIEALGELDPYSAAPDGEILAQILTAYKQQLADPLTLFWQESFRKGRIPEELKTQYITPIYKKGDRTDLANYRPVFLTSHIMNTFERVIRKHLVRHLEENMLLNKN
jgi:hypothetical protein